MPVHLFGLCWQMDEIRAVAETYCLAIIEDAAQAIGAEYLNRSDCQQAGTMGNAGFFSFYPSKNLGAAGDAGLIVTDDEALAHRLRVCRNHGMEPQYFHQMIGETFDSMKFKRRFSRSSFRIWTNGRRDAAASQGFIERNSRAPVYWKKLCCRPIRSIAPG